MKHLRMFLLPILLLMAPAAARADLDALVDSVVGTYGGTAALARLESHRVLATVDALFRQRSGRVTKDFRAPDRLRVEIRYPDSTELRILNGNKGWRGDDRSVQPVEGPPKVAMVYQLLRSVPVWSLHTHRRLLEDRGDREAGGLHLRRVGLPWGDGLDLEFWVDTVSRRVVWVEADLRLGAMQTRFATAYDDFRRVDGVLFPFLEQNYAGGRHTGTTRVTEVRFAPANLGPFVPARVNP